MLTQVRHLLNGAGASAAPAQIHGAGLVIAPAFRRARHEVSLR
jgi:hypothetical protein